jgi:transposase
MGKLRLSRKERDRLEVLRKVESGKLSRRAAAELLGVSYRQLLRLVERYLADGAAGLKHRLRERESNRRIGTDRQQRIVSLYRSKYHDFGPTLAVEYLAGVDGEHVGIETLRRWLIQAGLWQARRRGARHRAWRERRAHRGELVQMDGSEHDWFEGRRAKATLMVLIDDATNWTYAKFFESETTVAAMVSFWEYVKRYRLPRALYVDRDSIYEITRDSTVDEALRDQSPLTQFGRAMQTLGVELILAHSPQAKGRVERRHGVFQDRLVKALRLKGISNLDAANKFLDQEFLSELNERFHVSPRAQADVHRAVPRDVRLEHVLCFQEARTVRNDWTVSWRNRVLQLSEKHQKLALAGKKIMVSELLEGKLRLTHRGRELNWTELPARPLRPVPKRVPAKQTKGPHKPPAHHPWR